MASTSCELVSLKGLLLEKGDLNYIDVFECSYSYIPVHSYSIAIPLGKVMGSRKTTFCFGSVECGTTKYHGIA